MAIIKKASRRKTSPAREAAGQQAAARSTQRRKAANMAARESQDVRQSGRSGSRAIQAHVQARGQRGQANRDSR